MSLCGCGQPDCGAPGCRENVAQMIAKNVGYNARARLARSIQRTVVYPGHYAQVSARLILSTDRAELSAVYDPDAEYALAASHRPETPA